MPNAANLRPKRRPLRWRWRRYVVLGVAAYCAWIGRGEWVSYHRLQATALGLDRQATALKAQQTELESEIAFAQTDAYVAAAARSLGLVSPNEVPVAPVPVPRSSGQDQSTPKKAGGG